MGKELIVFFDEEFNNAYEPLWEEDDKEHHACTCIHKIWDARRQDWIQQKGVVVIPYERLAQMETYSWRIKE